MRFNSILISSFFASAVLAAPGRERRLFRVAETVPADSFWAGKVATLEHGNIQFVSSIIHAPDIAGQTVGSSAIAFIGIDGAGACSNMLRIGVVFNVTTEGPSYTVVYQHDNGSKGYVNDSDMHINAGDEIKLTVDAPLDVNRKQFEALITVNNLSSNQNFTTQISNLTESLCGKAAEWVVENLADADSSPLVVNSMMNFGTLTFAHAQVGGNDFQQLDSNLVNIVENGIILTSVSANDDSVTVTWL
ncbi:peptidase G1 [Boletus edulis]|nr:peptidase G1 [Boletus edulis]